MLKRVLFVVVVVLLLTVPSFAQELPGEVVVDGLVNPRNLSLDAEGNLYIAEAGNAGPQLTDSDTAFGSSSQITRVSADGEAAVIVHGLISYREGNALGAHATYITDESIWVLIGETSDFRIPFSHALVELDKDTMRIKTFVDLLTPELELDPDSNPNEQSNPTDFDVAPDGTIYIANAGCNCLMSWTPEAGVQIAAAWPFDTDNPVPTSVEVDANGDIYVGFLTGFPFPAEGSRVEKWSGGELVTTYPGLTTVTGLEVTADGTIYAVEAGLQDGMGRLVQVTEEGPVVIAEGLPAPYGVVMGADGNLLVSIGSIGGQGGAVISIPVEM
ncbi:MAG: hypothetical protein OHK0046_21550 [Anaerolineae bacterium]